MFYSPSDIFRNYAKLQLQVAVLEYVSCHDGVSGEEGFQGILELAKHIDKTVANRVTVVEISNAATYLAFIGLLKVEDHKLYITEAGIECLQKYTLQTVVISTRIGFVTYANWIICTLISLSALIISVLK